MNITSRTFAVPLAVVLITCLGCALFPTRGRRGSPDHAGFLGDYSQLAEHPDYPAQEVYLDPQAVWSQYDSIEIDSVTLWVNEGTAKLKDKDRQMLTDLVYKALHEKLARCKLQVGDGDVYALGDEETMPITLPPPSEEE